MSQMSWIPPAQKGASSAPRHQAQSFSLRGSGSSLEQPSRKNEATIPFRTLPTLLREGTSEAKRRSGATQGDGSMSPKGACSEDSSPHWDPSPKRCGPGSAAFPASLPATALLATANDEKEEDQFIPLGTPVRTPRAAAAVEDEEEDAIPLGTPKNGTPRGAVFSSPEGPVANRRTSARRVNVSPSRRQSARHLMMDEEDIARRRQSRRLSLCRAVKDEDEEFLRTCLGEVASEGSDAGSAKDDTENEDSEGGGGGGGGAASPRAGVMASFVMADSDDEGEGTWTDSDSGSDGAGAGLEDMYSFDPEQLRDMVSKGATVSEMAERIREAMAGALERRLARDVKAPARRPHRPRAQPLIPLDEPVTDPDNLEGRMTPPGRVCATPASFMMTSSIPEDDASLDPIQQAMRQAMAGARARHRISIGKAGPTFTIAEAQANARLRKRLSIAKATEVLEVAGAPADQSKVLDISKAMEEARRRHRLSIETAVMSLGIAAGEAAEAEVAEGPISACGAASLASSKLSATAAPFGPVDARSVPGAALSVEDRIKQAVAAAHARKAAESGGNVPLYAENAVTSPTAASWEWQAGADGSACGAYPDNTYSGTGCQGGAGGWEAQGAGYSAGYQDGPYQGDDYQTHGYQEAGYGAQTAAGYSGQGEYGMTAGTGGYGGKGASFAGQSAGCYGGQDTSSYGCQGAGLGGKGGYSGKGAYGNQDAGHYGGHGNAGYGGKGGFGGQAPSGYDGHGVAGYGGQGGFEHHESYHGQGSFCTQGGYGGQDGGYGAYGSQGAGYDQGAYYQDGSHMGGSFHGGNTQGTGYGMGQGNGYQGDSYQGWHAGAGGAY